MARITKKGLFSGKGKLPRRRIQFDGERLACKESLTGSGWHRKSEVKSIGREYVYNTADWKSLRMQVIQEQPLCEVCLAEGRMVSAEEVDHIVPISVDPDKAFDRANLWGLCKSHHAKKTRLEQSVPNLQEKGVYYWGPKLTNKEN